MKLRILIAFKILIGISWFFFILYFLASIDIYHDYISRQLIESYNIKANSLPSWTSTSGEWFLVKLDYVVRIIFTVFIVWLLSVKASKTEYKKFILNFMFGFSIVFAMLLIPYTLAFLSIYNNYGGNYKYVKLVIDNTIFGEKALCTIAWNFLQYELYIRLIFMCVITVYSIKPIWRGHTVRTPI